MKQTDRKDKAFDFIDGFGVFGWLFSGLISLAVFAYVFYGLFAVEQPIFSAIFATFVGLIAACIVSPLTALLGFSAGALISGLMALGTQAKPKS